MVECRVGVVVGQVSKDRQALYDIVSISQPDATPRDAQPRGRPTPATAVTPSSPQPGEFSGICVRTREGISLQRN